MNFTDRTSYLAYRSNWKLEYKKLSLQIRAHKLEIKRAARAGESTSSLDYQRYCLRRQATAMLNELASAKERAGELREQYLLEKAAKGSTRTQAVLQETAR